MKLIVGLGNPGRKYEHTRHNAGFEVVAELVRRYAVSAPKNRFHGECVDVRFGGDRVLLLCPTTYMNRSGRSAAAACSFYGIEPEDVLVVCDDMHLPVGKLRFRSKGTAGGQKGLADVVRHLGTEDVPRLRVGVGTPPPHWDHADYVLGRFAAEEQEVIKQAYQRAADGLVEWVEHGLDRCMNKYNGT